MQTEIAERAREVELERTTAVGGFDLRAEISSITQERAMLASALAKIEDVAQFVTERSRTHEWPEGAFLAASRWQVTYNEINVRIPFDEQRPWVDTAHVAYLVRKFFGIPTLRRLHSSSSKSTFYTGTLALRTMSECSLTITCEDSIPDSCKLEVVTESVTIEQKRYKVVCQ